jgi:hypothetical protein
LLHRTIEELKGFAMELMEIGENDGSALDHNAEVDENNDDHTDGDDHTDDGPGTSWIAPARLRDRYDWLTKLRRTFLKLSEEELRKSFSFLPRWRCMPEGWMNQLEFLFFKEICERGWSITNNRILKMPEFEGLFQSTVGRCFRCYLHRLTYVLGFIERHPLETLGKQVIVRTTRLTCDADGGAIQIPEIVQAFTQTNTFTLLVSNPRGHTFQL